ncbi:hypothetical protein QE152_g15305 [Popillia japonica]|uniref:Uncharacterized protein n=1 Tax=Popillia japonica TaxID=7064 RepID=A0AAW1LA71_POPJA
MFTKIALVTLVIVAFSANAQNPIRCTSTLDETMVRGGELCFFPHKVQFTETVRGKNLKFSFPIEEFSDVFQYKADEKSKYFYEDYFEVK